jgi:hypothetical protein
MRRSGISLCAALALAGCSASTVYYAEGVDLSTRAADLAQCEAQALQAFPVRNETRYTPRRFVPPRQSCDADGNCTESPGYFEGGEPYTVDVNADPRQTALRGCMGDRGYAEVNLPFCEPESRVRPTTVMPPLTEATCVYRPAGRGDGVIVNPL